MGGQGQLVAPLQSIHGMQLFSSPRGGLQRDARGQPPGNLPGLWIVVTGVRTDRDWLEADLADGVLGTTIDDTPY